MRELLTNSWQVAYNLISQSPYLWIFTLMTIESSFIPFPSEVVMIPAWYFASQWTINIFLAIIMGTAWSILWALINYYIAKFGWEKITIKLIWEKNFNIWVYYFKENWESITFFSRLVPVIRQLMSLPAGLFHMNIKKFIIYTGLWAGIWVIFLTYVWYICWENKELLNTYKTQFTIIVILIIAIMIIWKIYFIKHLNKKANKKNDKKVA